MSIVHGHIREDVITFHSSSSSNNNNQSSFSLTALWEAWNDRWSELCVEAIMNDRSISLESAMDDVQPPTIAKLWQDIHAVGHVLHSTMGEVDSTNGVITALQHIPGRPMDPILYETLGMMTTEIRLGDPSKFHKYVSQLTGSNDLSPFIETTLSISLKLRFHAGKRQDEIQVPASDVIQLWECYIRCGKFRYSPEDLVLKILRDLREKFSEQIPLRDLKRIVRRCQPDLCELYSELQTPKGTLLVSVVARVLWLRGSSKVNLSQLLKAFGLSEHPICPSASIEVRGLAKHSGIYVEHGWLKRQTSAQIMCRQLMRPPDMSTSEWPRKHLQKYDHRQFVFFSTGLPLSCLIIIKREDLSAMWEPFSERNLASDDPPKWLSLEQTIKRCEQYRLTELKDSDRELTRDRLHGGAHQLCAQTAGKYQCSWRICHR